MQPFSRITKNALPIYTRYVPGEVESFPEDREMREKASNAGNQHNEAQRHTDIDALHNSARIARHRITERRNEKTEEARNILEDYDYKLSTMRAEHGLPDTGQESKYDADHIFVTEVDLDPMVGALKEACKNRINATKKLNTFYAIYNMHPSTLKGSSLAIIPLFIAAGLEMVTAWWLLRTFSTDIVAAISAVLLVLANVATGFGLGFSWRRLLYCEYFSNFKMGQINALLIGLFVSLASVGTFLLASYVLLATRAAGKKSEIGQSADFGSIFLNSDIVFNSIEDLDLPLSILSVITFSVAFAHFYNQWGRREANPVLWSHMNAVIAEQKSVDGQYQRIAKILKGKKSDETKSIDTGLKEISQIEKNTISLKNGWLNDSKTYQLEADNITTQAKKLANIYFKIYNQTRRTNESGGVLEDADLRNWEDAFDNFNKGHEDVIPDAQMIEEINKKCEEIRTTSSVLRRDMKNMVQNANKRWDNYYTNIKVEFETMMTEIKETELGS